MRGGFTVRDDAGPREPRVPGLAHRSVSRGPTRTLTIKWERFVSKLEPAQKETWTGDRERARREEGGSPRWSPALYDASLDAYLAAQLASGASTCSGRIDSRLRPRSSENPLMNYLQGIYPRQLALSIKRPARSELSRTEPCRLEIVASIPVGLPVRCFWGTPAAADAAFPAFRWPRRPTGAVPAVGAVCGGRRGTSRVFANRLAGDGERRSAEATRPRSKTCAPVAEGAPQGPDLSQVAARKNLNETAFFFPHLISDDDGEVRLEFTMPEALTEWKFLGFAHDSQLRGGLLTDSVVTAKDLMVQPNPPRFLREGDVLEFTVKVSNQSAARQTGAVRLRWPTHGPPRASTRRWATCKRDLRSTSRRKSRARSRGD